MRYSFPINIQNDLTAMEQRVGDTGDQDVLTDECESVTEAPSPFLPGTKVQFAWDSTCLGLIKTCPRLYQYKMIDGWDNAGESVHLRFGQEYHSALQDYEIEIAKGLEPEAAIRSSVAALLRRTCDWVVDTTVKPGKYKNRDSLLRIVVGYLDHYGPNDPATTYILDNGKPAVELSFRFELDFGPVSEARTGWGPNAPETDAQPYLLCGHLDRVVEFNGALLVLDHKTTTTTLSSTFFAQWSPSNQMTLYTLAGKVVLDAPIRGVVISGAQLLIDSPDRFVRGFTFRTQDQLDEWLVDLEHTLRAAESYATANYWPMNDTACDKFGGCRFREVCSKDPAVRDRFLESDFTKLPENERWNPLKSR